MSARIEGIYEDTGDRWGSHTHTGHPTPSGERRAPLVGCRAIPSARAGSCRRHCHQSGSGSQRGGGELR